MGFSTPDFADAVFNGFLDRGLFGTFKEDDVAENHQLQANMVLEAVDKLQDDASHLRSSLQGCLDQMYQMQGMFNDDDGQIQAAIDDAEKQLEKLKPAPATAAPKPGM